MVSTRQIALSSFRFLSLISPHCPSLSSPFLLSVNLRVKPKELVAVVGHVGAGKSSLIQALLGEMEKTSGKVSLKVRAVRYQPDSIVQE